MVQADNGGGGGPTLDPKAHANERELFKIFGFEYWSVDWAANDWLTSAARIRSVAKDVRTTITQLESGDGTKDNPAWTGPSAVAACASMEQLAKSLDTRASEIDKARLGMEQVTKDSSWAREQWYARVYPIKTTLDERDYQRISGPDGVDHARMAQDEQALYAKRDAEAKKILTELNQRIATSTASMPVDYVPPQDPYSGSVAGGGTGGGGGNTTTRSVGDVRGPKGGGTGLEPVRPPVGPIVDPIPPDRPICVLPPPILPETPDCELPPPEPPVIDNGGTDVISMDGTGTGTTQFPSTGGAGGVSTGHAGVGGVSAGGGGSVGALGMGGLGGRGVPGLGAAGRGVSAVGAGSGRGGARGPGSSVRGATGTGKYGTPLVGVRALEAPGPRASAPALVDAEPVRVDAAPAQPAGRDALADESARWARVEPWVQDLAPRVGGRGRTGVKWPVSTVSPARTKRPGSRAPRRVRRASGSDAAPHPEATRRRASMPLAAMMLNGRARATVSPSRASASREKRVDR